MSNNNEESDRSKLNRMIFIAAPSKKLQGVVDSIKLKLVAKMEQVAIELENARRPITNLKVFLNQLEGEIKK